MNPKYRSSQEIHFNFLFFFSNYETYNFKKEQSLFVRFVYGKAGSPIHNLIFTSIYLGRSLVDVLGVLSRPGLCVLLVIFNDDCGDDCDDIMTVIRMMTVVIMAHVLRYANSPD